MLRSPLLRRLSTSAAAAGVPPIAPPQSARARRRQRRDALPRLRSVRRTNGPESDMRAHFPARGGLLAFAHATAPGAAASSARAAPEPRSRDAPLDALCVRARAAAAAGDAGGVAAVVAEAAEVAEGDRRDVAVRVVALDALRCAAGGGGSAEFAEEVVTRLSQNGCLGGMRRDDVGAVLDVMARAMAARGDGDGAFRIEFLSRALEVGLRRGTYTALIRLVGGEGTGEGMVLALGMFHRALVLEKKPNAAMFNALLEVCFNARDGVRARAVLVQMAREGVAANGETLDILLRNTHEISNVDAVFHLLQTQVSEHGLNLTRGMARPFLKAYIATAGQAAAPSLPTSLFVGQDEVYIEKCFAVVDWFYDRNVGVTGDCLDLLLTHLGESGNAEGCLHAWREMRRGWLGSPSKRGRRALVQSVAASQLPSRVDKVVWPRLSSHMTARERRRLQRVIFSANGTNDDVVLNLDGEEMDPVQAGEQARDRAAVLHRWCAEGRRPDVMDWLAEAFRREIPVDSRVLLSVLSLGSAGRENPDRSALEFALDNLGQVTRPVDALSRVAMVDHATDAVWRWGNNTSGTPLDESRVGRDECFKVVEQLVPTVVK